MNTYSKPYSIDCKGHLFLLDTTQIMGILNVTENSFYDGGKYFSEEKAINRAEEMIREGASIIDIGASSTRQGSAMSRAEDELLKLIPIVHFLNKNYPDTLLSIDTYHSSVAEACIQSGAHIINDISGGTIDENIFHIASKYKTPLILMHMQGVPQTMQIQPSYTDVVQEVFQFLLRQSEKAAALGIQDIIVDVGFGFGKTVEHNFELLKNLEVFQLLKRPVLVGVSRKSMIWKTLQVSPDDALNGTTALHIIALEKGAKILRVHDVKAAQETITLFNQLQIRSE